MKHLENILIATDFSNDSINAAKFGLEIAKKFSATVHFLHIYSLPLINAEVPDYYSFSEYHKIKEKQLKKMIKELPVDELKVKQHCIAGISFASEIEDFSKKHEVDLIVTGLTGSTTLEEILMGSNTLYLVTHSSIPVLAVPKKFTAKEQMNFALAVDGKAITPNGNIDLFHEVSKKYTKKIHAFHVTETDSDIKLQHDFPTDEFDLKIVKGENINDGILKFVSDNQIDILGIVPRKHSFFDRLFHESYTKEFTKYSTIPVFTIPS